jgi:hypothetical protein
MCRAGGGLRHRLQPAARVAKRAATGEKRGAREGILMHANELNTGRRPKTKQPHRTINSR